MEKRARATAFCHVLAPSVLLTDDLRARKMKTSRVNQLQATASPDNECDTIDCSENRVVRVSASEAVD